MNEQTQPLEDIHQAWTIYHESNGDITPMLSPERPQDWGDPEWMYRLYILEAQGYRYHAHCWIREQVEEFEHLQWFAEAITTILLPPSDPELCGNTYLQVEDFWMPEWGDMPQVYDPYE